MANEERPAHSHLSNNNLPKAHKMDRSFLFRFISSFIFFSSFDFIVTTVRIIIIHMIAVAALNRFGWKWWKWWWWCNIYSTFEGILFTYDIIRPSHVHYFLFCSFPQSTQIDLSLFVSDACINTPCKPSKSNDFNYFSSSDCHSLLGHALKCSNKPIFAKFYSLQYFGCCMEY